MIPIELSGRPGELCCLSILNFGEVLFKETENLIRLIQPLHPVIVADLQAGSLQLAALPAQLIRPVVPTKDVAALNA